MTLTDEQFASIRDRQMNAEHASKADIHALLTEVERQRKFEADALPVLDAYEHMHTRAVRAEAEVESLRHDIARHMEIANEHLAEIEELRKPVGKEEWP